MIRVMIKLIILIGFVPLAQAQTLSDKSLREARSLYSRLNGVPPSPARQQKIAKFIDAGNLRQAALAAIDLHFYNTTLKNMVGEWTNENDTRRVDLNDYIATVVGMVRDEVPFDSILWEDITYVFEAPNLPPFSLMNNEHYTEAEAANFNLAESLVRKKQSEITPLPKDATSGVLSSRAFGEAFYQAGTNRAAFKAVMKTYYCREMEELTDNTRADFRVRQDVDRSPGGETKVFRSKCAGCHAGMDGMNGSMAYYDYTPDDGLTYDPNNIPDKYFRSQETFPKGFKTVDDSWVNLWVEGPNKALGWKGLASGKGLKAWGKMISKAEAFPTCMAERVLFEVCRSNDKSVINQLANRFKNGGRFNLKHLFADAALTCRALK